MRRTPYPETSRSPAIKSGVPSQFLVTMPHEGAIIFADLIGKLDM
jgi:hypothetical protein